MSAEFYTALKINSRNVCDEAVRILVKIIDNIVQNPNNLKIRTIQKNNSTIKLKILDIHGGIACLTHLGFKENETSFTLPQSAKIEHLMAVKSNLLNLWTAEPPKITSNVDPNVNLPDLDRIKRFVLPPLKTQFTNKFLQKVETYFHSMQAYADKACQQRALSLIPVIEIRQKAETNLRNYNETIKKQNQPEPTTTLQDFQLIELLDWFKNDFFIWVDTPNCIHCSSTTKMSHMSTDLKDLEFTQRVEVYCCVNCQKMTKFPRYNDLNLLMETQRGRCGEWAQVFTLFCIAMNWDARFVADESDHVWCEVYSIGRQKWVHCDPCENACDTPLMYENGWGKKHTYVMAYSIDEVQDVTWRYTSHFNETLLRRTEINENELIAALFTLRNDRQKAFSATKRNYLTKRILSELIEFMVEQKPGDGEMQGRISGSKNWRLERGEIIDSKQNQFFWLIQDDDLVNDKVLIEYSAASDLYQLNGRKKLNGWKNGVLSYEGVFRKEEKDWKIVYLARKEGLNKGSISWKIKIDVPNKVLDTVSLELKRNTYENGAIDIKIESDNLALSLKDEKLESEQFRGVETLTITVDLYGGKGNVAWQHSQLFRQSITDCTDFPFKLLLNFKNK